MIRLAVRVRREQAELVLAELLQLCPTGVEELDPEPGIVEYAVYGSPGELPTMPDLDARVGEALVEVSATEVADDWHERWKQFHRPVRVSVPAGTAAGGLVTGGAGAGAAAAGAAAAGGRAAATVPQLYIRPPWEPALGEPDTIDVAIDPGQAFGTGAHATTRLCLELLLEMLAAGIAPGPLIDIGTGSGVLAISAGKLGFSPLLALDNDRDSVQAARDNARANGVQLTVRRHDLRREPLPLDGAVAGAGGATHGALTVTANLLAPLLLTLAQSLAREQRPMQHLIAGGLLAGEVDAVARALCDAGAMRERERRERGEWAALWLQAS